MEHAPALIRGYTKMAARHLLLAALLSASLPALAETTITETNLTSDGAVPAPVIDPNLKNPWGISFGPGGPFWVSDNATGLTTLYDGTGAIQQLVVAIPAAGGSKAAGSPTGQVFNPTSGFVVSANGQSGPASFIFVTEDGTISGWNFGVDQGSAVVTVDNSAKGATYKGCALYTNKKTGATYLLATNFRAGVVEVYDSTYKLVGKFRDTTLDRKLSPYNVAVLNGQIYVTYAEVDPVRHDSVAGVGKGAVELVNFSGKTVFRYVHGKLNAPWGLVQAPAGFGPLAGRVLVGNFGDGTIDIFSPKLAPHGVLLDTTGGPLVIEGLWALIAGNGGKGGATDTIYFSAGINLENDGVLGALTVTP